LWMPPARGSPRGEGRVPHGTGGIISLRADRQVGDPPCGHDPHTAGEQTRVVKLLRPRPVQVVCPLCGWVGEARKPAACSIDGGAASPGVSRSTQRARIGPHAADRSFEGHFAWARTGLGPAAPVFQPAPVPLYAVAEAREMRTPPVTTFGLTRRVPQGFGSWSGSWSVHWNRVARSA
jgi:hypothetical protein